MFKDLILTDMHTLKQKTSACTSAVNANRLSLENYLSALGVAFRTVEHPPALTVADLMEHVGWMDGLHAKNLFVKDKKTSKLFLITTRHDAQVSLSGVAKLVGVKELRFADEQALATALGVARGSVTPFALMNDAEHQVNLVLDRHLFGQDSDVVHFHPLTNDATTGVSVCGFKTFLKATGHQPTLITI